MRMISRAVLVLGAACLASCHTLPDPVETGPFPRTPPAQRGEVARAARILLGDSRSGASAVVPVMSNKDALDSRLALIDSARTSLEIQLFIWMDDYTGRIIMERVLMAADRGVKVRILLDDLLLGISYTDRQLAAVCSHPNVQLRLYNPNKLRDRIVPRALDLVTHVGERNQRMHNKTIVADGSLAILSGRNIGDHYFGYGHRYNLVDFGALFAGPVLVGIRDGFERYWGSAPSYDAAAFIRTGRTMPLESFRSSERQKIRREKHPAGRRIPLARRDWAGWFRTAAARAHRASAVYLEDAPEIPSPSRPVIAEILRQCEQSRKEIIMVTPYLVPDRRIMAMLRSVRARGVRVVLLVPTVASNNHLVVHNQYQKYRRVLLGMGVEIHEFKHRPGRSMTGFINEGENLTRKVGLHTKLVVIDSQVTYLGSMNFDGRAMFVNTEEGAVVRSASLARELRQWTARLMAPENSWRLTLDRSGGITWVSGKSSRTHEPAIDFLHATLEFMLRPLSLRHRVFPDGRVYKKPGGGQVPSGAANTAVQ